MNISFDDINALRRVIEDKDMTRKDYEIAIDELVLAEKSYKQLEEYFLSGDAAADIAAYCGGSREKFKLDFQQFIERLQRAVEDVNVKAINAKNAFRAAVHLTHMQQRGPDGRPTTITYGSLTVSSTTKRWLDAESLLKLAANAGVLDRLLSLTGLDKNGKAYRLVEQVWKIDYENVTKWLIDNNLHSVIQGSYDEKEETPRVSGVKTIAFLGEKVERV